MEKKSVARYRKACEKREIRERYVWKELKREMSLEKERGLWKERNKWKDTCEKKKEKKNVRFDRKAF